MKKTKGSVNVKVTHNVEYNRLKLLLIASYLLGQEMGLNGHTYDSPDCKRQRDNLISFIFNGETHKKDGNITNT